MPGEGRTGRTGTISSDASFEVQGQANNALNKRLRQVEQTIRASQPQRAIALPTPLTPWPLTVTGEPGGEFDTVAIAIPFETTTLRIWIKRTADGLKAQLPFDFDDITQAERIAQRIERTIPKKLDYLTSYDLMAIVAFKEGGGKAVNQNSDGVTPLLQWTTGANVIGTGVPLLLGLERTAIGSAAFGSNTTTSYYLDSGASGTDGAYVGSGENIWALHIPSLGAADRVRTITAYGGVTQQATVSPAWSAAPATGLTYEVHRGLTRAQNGGTQVDATHFVLDSGASGTTDNYAGMMIYMPSLAAADQIRKITAYNGTTKSCTLDAALSGIPGNNIGFMISRGSFGFAAVGLTGIITGVPFRFWRDGDTNEQVLEGILPTGSDALGITTVQFFVYKSGNGKLRFTTKIAASETPTYRFPLQTYIPSISMRVRNLYRGGGSDGWSGESYHASGNVLADTVNTYTPDTFVPVTVDYHDPGPFPSKKNWVY